MKLSFSDIKQEHDRDLYWVKVFVNSDNQTKECLACASWEWLIDEFHANDVSSKLLDKWLEIVSVDVQKNSDQSIFVYAETVEGQENGLNFLNEIRSI